MDWSLDDTIAALASAPGPAARGILRISGPQVRAVLDGWFQPLDAAAWNLSRRSAVHPGTLGGASHPPLAVDVYDWPTRRSYTGQPLLELHLPGSPPLLEFVLAEVIRRGVRPARPGEFTLRAFLAGKLDLLQAEAVLGVIDAHDHRELTVALGQLAGGLSGKLGELRRDLLDLLADLEAGLDFVEEDIEFVSRQELQARVGRARDTVEQLLLQTEDRMQSRGRARVVLAGLPNAGKSTLFNCLSGSAAALVHDQAGTTRDFLEASVEWSGLVFDLVDTAGWEQREDPIAAAAQRHRAGQIEGSDVVIWCSSATLDPTDRQSDEERFASVGRATSQVLRVQTQVDHERARVWLKTGHDLPGISARTGAGLDDLAALLRARLQSSQRPGAHWLGMTAARCRESLESASVSLTRAESAAASDVCGDELLAVDVREALDHLGKMLGAIYTDDILDRVFSKFCIGK